MGGEGGKIGEKNGTFGRICQGGKRQVRSPTSGKPEKSQGNSSSAQFKERGIIVGGAAERKKGVRVP